MRDHGHLDSIRRGNSDLGYTNFLFSFNECMIILIAHSAKPWSAYMEAATLYIARHSRQRVYVSLT